MASASLSSRNQQLIRRNSAGGFVQNLPINKGSYDEIGEAYAYIMKYAKDNGYKVSGLSRECYIDGIWNKESVEDWLTEIQLPIE